MQVLSPAPSSRSSTTTVHEPVISRGGGHPVVFVHIPKTAGSTLYQVMQRVYKPDEVVFLYESRIPQSVQMFDRLPEAAKRRLRMVLGHVGFGLHERLGRPCTYATVLREPVDRIISYYYFVLREPGHFLHGPARELGLEGFAKSEASHKLTNGQTKYLAELDGLDANRDTLEAAKRNLEKYFSVVGLIERFDETLVMLRHVAGWGLPYYDKANVTRDRPPKSEIPQSAIDTIREHNQLDMELYDWVSKRFEQAVGAAGLPLKAEVAALGAANKLYKLYRRARGRRPSNTSPRSSDLKHFGL
jgi:hypothetical protein